MTEEDIEKFTTWLMSQHKDELDKLVNDYIDYGKLPENLSTS